MCPTQAEIEAAIVATGEAISNGKSASQIAFAALTAAEHARRRHPVAIDDEPGCVGAAADNSSR